MIFNQPFPRESNFRKQLFDGIVSGLVVTFFLWIFKPFDIGLAPVSNLFYFALGYGFITTFVLIAFGIYENVRPKWFIEEKWTVGKNIVLYLVIIFGIGTLNLFYTVLMTNMKLTWQTFISFQLITLAVTFVVTSALTMFKYFRSLNFYRKEIQKIEEEVAELEPAEENVSVTIKSEFERETLILSLNDLFYIESADNYCKVVYRQNNKITSTLLRNSLRKLQDQLTQPELFRCHRTYIVQLRNIERVSGNSQGYRLHFANIPDSVPVSRRLNQEIHERLATL